MSSIYEIVDEIDIDSCEWEDADNDLWCDELNDHTKKISLSEDDLSASDIDEFVEQLCNAGAEEFDSILETIIDTFGDPSAPSSTPIIFPSHSPTLTCIDSVENWEDSTGESCDRYVEENWCVEYGDGFAGTNSLTANEACCGCGGGYISSSSTAVPTSVPSNSTSMPSILLQDMQTDISFQIRTLNATESVSVTQGELGNELKNEIREIIRSEFSINDNVDLTFVSVEKCSEDETCFTLLVRIKIKAATLPSEEELESAIRDGQTDGYYFSNSIPTYLAPIPSNSNQSQSIQNGSSDDGMIISIFFGLTGAFIIIFIFFVRYIRKNREKEVKSPGPNQRVEDELVLNEEEYFDDIPRSVTLSTPNSNHKINQASSPKSMDTGPRSPSSLRDGTTGSGSKDDRSVSWDIPEVEKVSIFNEEPSAPGSIPVSTEYNPLNTSMEATVEAQLNETSPVHMHLHPQKEVIERTYIYNNSQQGVAGDWGESPSVSTGPSEMEEKSISNDIKPSNSYTDQALDIVKNLAQYSDTICASMSGESGGKMINHSFSNSDYEGDGRQGSMDDGSTWATEETPPPKTFNSASYVSTIEPIPEEDPDLMVTSNALPIPTTISATNISPSKLKPSGMTRTHTEITAVTTNTASTRQVSNTAKAYERSAKSKKDSPNISIMPSLEEELSISEEESDESNSNDNKVNTSQGPIDDKGRITADDSSSLGSLGELSSIDGSQSSHQNDKKRAVVDHSNQPEKVESGANNSEFNDWFQNEIDSLKQKGSWQDIQRVIESTPDIDDVTSRSPPMIQMNESMPDDEMEAIKNTREIQKNAPIMNTRKMYT